ncbi:MAG: hypothetical protein NXI01_00005 [Gammaproteobacteria bacterium]|nr:hypothetical protein [Gammaproteobacteria bacterium]
MLPLNTVVMKEPHELVVQFSNCIDGQLNDASLGFVKSIAHANPNGLKKLIDKFQQLQLQVDADACHLVMNALTDQINIPRDALQSIQTYLQKDSNRKLLQELQQLSSPKSRLQQSVSKVMDNLNIFSDKTIEQQFLRSILSIMIDWTHDHKYRSSKHAVKWLTTILGISQKSDLSNLLRMIADQLYLSEYVIQGKSRQMDCLELFFSLENLTTTTDMNLISAPNKPLMKNIHATLVIGMICKHSPHAFYDVVASEAYHQHDTALTQVQKYQPAPLHWEQFFKSTAYKAYFSKKPSLRMVAHHSFIDTLMTHIQKHADLKNLTAFIDRALEAHADKNPEDFLIWFNTQMKEPQLQPMVQSLLFTSVYQATLQHKASNAGRIRSGALQLVALGFSHRSAAALKTGCFQPLVNTEIAAIDVMNIEAMVKFFEQQTPELQAKLMHELFLLIVLDTHRQRCAQKLRPPKAMKQRRNFKHFKPATKQLTIPKKIRPNAIQRDRLFTHRTLPAASQPAKISRLTFSK